MSLGLRVGVLVPFVGGDHFGAIIAGVSAAAAADRGSVIAVQMLTPGTRSADHSGTPPLRYPIAWQHFDAAVVVGRAMAVDGVRRLQEAGKPVVTISHRFPDVQCPLVSPDNRGGVQQAVRHLVEHGHRRIAFAGFLEHQDIRQRHEGYLAALAEAGLPSGPELLLPAPDNDASGGRAVGRQLLRLAERDGGRLLATAVVTGTDRNAIGLLEALAGTGVEVPEQLAVIGFDDILEARHIDPGLSTVQLRLPELGALAFELLGRLSLGTCPPDTVAHVPTALVTRHSCGCPPETADAAQSRAQDWYQETMQLQEALNVQYELSVDLLSTHRRDPRDLAWMVSTPVPAGYLGLWPAVVDDDQGPGGGDGDDGGAAGPAAEPDPDPQIRVVGRFPKGAEGTGTESIPVSAFPPADLFGAADPDGGRLVLVVPVRTEAQDWGVLAMVDRNRSFTPPGRELINNAASLLSVALDHDAVLRSLKRQQQRLHHAALFDPLTGLPNRTLLLDRLRQSAHRAARRPDRQFALLFLDLNGFKNINDTLGHAAGDQLLVEVAHRLTRILRRTDTAARMGGDEFVVLLDGLHNPDEATLTAERVRARVTEPMVIDGRSVGVGVSIGVSRSDEGSLDVDELLRRADSAMYRAKLQSRRDAASSQ